MAKNTNVADVIAAVDAEAFAASSGTQDVAPVAAETPAATDPFKGQGGSYVVDELTQTRVRRAD